LGRLRGHERVALSCLVRIAMGCWFRTSRETALCAMGALTLAACTTTRPPDADPLPAEVRNNLVTISVVTTPAYAVLGQDIETPVAGAGRGALHGAGQGAVGSVAAGFVSSNGAGLVVGILLAAPAGLVGGVVGAARAHSSAEVAETDAAIREVLAAAHPENDV